MKPMMRIESDGTPHGTRIFDADGKQIMNVRSVTIRVDPDDGATAMLECVLVGYSIAMQPDRAVVQFQPFARLRRFVRVLRTRIGIAIARFTAS